MGKSKPTPTPTPSPTPTPVAGLSSSQCDPKEVAVAILKASSYCSANTQSVLTPGLIDGIISAESKRKGNTEAVGEWVARGMPRTGWLPGTRGTGKWLDKQVGGLGPGQLYRPAHSDVITNFGTGPGSELQQFVNHMNTNCNKSLKQQGFPHDVEDADLSNFFIAAYLAWNIERAQKPGRSPDDALKFGIGLFHGARKTIVDAQKAVSPKSPGSVTAWKPIDTHLRSSKDKKNIDVADYVDEVFNSR